MSVAFNLRVLRTFCSWNLNKSTFSAIYLKFYFIKVQFYDVRLVLDSFFSEVFLCVPDTSVHAGNVQLGVVNFTSNQVVAAVDTAVGSNSPFTLKSNDQIPITCNTHGQLICSVSWGLDDQGQVLGPKKVAKDPLFNENDPVSADPISAIGADAAQDPRSVSKWVQDNRIDPNDPENAALIPFMQDVEGHALALDYFRLEQLQVSWTCGKFLFSCGHSQA